MTGASASQIPAAHLIIIIKYSGLLSTCWQIASTRCYYFPRAPRAQQPFCRPASCTSATKQTPLWIHLHLTHLCHHLSLYCATRLRQSHRLQPNLLSKPINSFNLSPVLVYTFGFKIPVYKCSKVMNFSLFCLFSLSLSYFLVPDISSSKCIATLFVEISFSFFQHPVFLFIS